MRLGMMKDVETIIKKLVTEKEVVCKKCGMECRILKDSKLEYCEQCKFDYFMESCETKFKP